MNRITATTNAFAAVSVAVAVTSTWWAATVHLFS